MRKKIGECLIQAGLITDEELQVALAEHKRTGDRLGAVLVRLNFATEQQIARALAYQLGFPYANLADAPPDPEAIALIARDVALERICVAVRLEKNLLTVAMSDPLLFSLVQDLEFRTGRRITPVVATRTDILSAIEHGYPDRASSKPGSWSGSGMDVPPAPPLDELGLSAAAMEAVRQCLRHQHGMILVVGPAGSGKTTTVSSAITSIRSGHSSIISIEDPIEYRIPGVNQTQVNEEATLTFASALRAVLRQDPDVLLVGEIRDQETARIAMQAARTGHLVLSTLDTDDAPSTMTRLRDMGMEPYVTASALVGIVAQRLVRRLCGACRRQYTPDGGTLRTLGITEPDAARFAFYRAVGCAGCHHTGYRGRIAICEVMHITDRMRRLIAHGVGEDMLRYAAIGAGMITLGEDGLSKVTAGMTAPEELLRVVTEACETRTRCPGCGATVAVDFMACPHCGQRLKAGCGRCRRTLQADWQFCPYCAAAQQTSPRRRLREQDDRLELPASSVAELRNQVR